MSPISLEPPPFEFPEDETTFTPGSSQPQRILVAEDDSDIRELYFEVLIGSGYYVDTAEDGAAGWQMLHTSGETQPGYDLLITDNEMPKLTGVELIEKVRFAHMTLPVILASGSAPTNTTPLQLAAILPKPFSLDQLMKTVEAVLHAADGNLVNHRKMATEQL